MERTELLGMLGLREPLDEAPAWAAEGNDVPWRGVRLRRVVLARSDGRAVPCLYLRPEGSGPWPAAVAVHQHNGEYHLGKSEPAGQAGSPDMAYGLELCAHGLAVLIPDLVGFEERRGPLADPAAYERLEAFRALVEGGCLQGRHTADVCLAVSWLRSRPEVAEGRVGVIGHSLGGQVAFFTMACDERIRAGVFSCGVGTLGSFFSHYILHNPAWYVPGLLARGDTPAVAALLRPRPCLITAGREDPIFPFAGVEEVAQAAGARVRAFEGGHAFPPAVRQAAYAFLKEALSA